MLLRRHRRFAQPTPKQVEKEPVVVEEKVEDIKEVPKYTKTEIFRMNKAELVERAKEIGIEDAEELSGNVLKGKLIEHYV